MAAPTSLRDPIAKLSFARGVVIAHSRRSRSGLTLIELLVVLFIIAVMLGLLLPAVQSARGRMSITACQNNLRQLSVALQTYRESTKKFPMPSRWTIDVLKWIEEWPLAEQLAGGIDDKNKASPRPHLFRCPSQPDYSSAIPGLGTCHYVMTVTRFKNGKPAELGNPLLHDREWLSEQTSSQPWYIGPEMGLTEQRQMFSQKESPHLSAYSIRPMAASQNDVN